MTDLYRKVLTLRTELWQLADNGRLDAPAGVDLTEVLRMVDAHLHTAEGLLRTPDGDVRIRCAPTDAHPAASSAHSASSAHAHPGPNVEEPAPGAHRDPFARPLSPEHAHRLAHLVRDYGRSRQPADVLARIYENASLGKTPTGIAAELKIAHTTALRAITAARELHPLT